MAFRVVHYINQFYAGIGGEEKADHKPEIREAVVGPGTALKAALGSEAEIVATVICGDSYFASNMEKASAEIIEMIKKYKVGMAHPAKAMGIRIPGSQQYFSMVFFCQRPQSMKSASSFTGMSCSRHSKDPPLNRRYFPNNVLA